MNGRIEAIT